MELTVLISGATGIAVGPAECVDHRCVGSSCAFVVRAAASFASLTAGSYYIFSYRWSGDADARLEDRLPVTSLYLEEMVPDKTSPSGFTPTGKLLDPANEEIAATLYATRDEAARDAELLSARAQLP